MKKTLILAALLSGITATIAHAAPSLAGIRDAGLYGGNHYFEIYWTLDAGDTCSTIANGNWEWVDMLQGAWGWKAPVYQSYAGPSGYSPLVCQVNIYSQNNTGVEPVIFLSAGTNYNCANTACNAGVLYFQF